MSAVSKLSDEEKQHLGTLVLEDYHFTRQRLAEVFRQISHNEVSAAELAPTRQQLEQRLEMTKGLCRKLKFYLPAEEST